ncbi:hypothetical protein LuPra_03060 [Luteitalea pratensis]|uniref:Uncharacterized protein n=2 Tax=Luteitalea pratensis TaxID=1855912 RepID=A0A143PPT4_LUTPR|nr:hypothetical protein LuPra_03060 [Luteitalea pratensis]
MGASGLRQMTRLGMLGGMAAVSAYLAYAGVTWLRYGRPRPAGPHERDEFLDRFMPLYDVVERQHMAVDAPAAVTLDVARMLALDTIPLARAIFRARDLLLGSEPRRNDLPAGLIDEMRALGWGVLAEEPGSEIVLGAVTRPWESNPTFHAVDPRHFAQFAAPGLVKIVWTLRADPVAPCASIFRTETRAMPTDHDASARFRTYWAFLSPGIRLIRRATLGPIKHTAERRFAASAG